MRTNKALLGAASMVVALVATAAATAWAGPAAAQSVSVSSNATSARIAAQAKALQPKVIAWRRDLHANPELGNREVRTAGIVAAHLKKLGMEVRTGVAKTGVIGILGGGKPGKVVALRADMDALPVEERTGLPFASKAKGEYMGKPVPVMHACGHDMHVAMLMGAAEMLAGMKSDIAGTVVFIFQPAEEGPPPGEEGGAALIHKEGALNNPKPDALFGMHVFPGPLGNLRYRSNGFMAASDRIVISIMGKQAHGSQPWAGVDIMSMGADIVQAMNQIAARRVDLQSVPHVITIATMHGGVRHNIIPDTLELTGTMRTFDNANRAKLIEEATRTVNHIAAAYGAKAEFKIDGSNAVTSNNPALVERMTPALRRAAGAAGVDTNPPVITGSEDFGHLAPDVPSLFAILGAARPGVDWKTMAGNHSPLFDPDEAAMETGVRAHAEFVMDFLNGGS